jgi:hypothetical protein
MEKYFQILSLQEVEQENGKPKKKLLPYQGGINFPFLPKRCAMCGGKSIRKPLGMHYLTFSTGYILVNLVKGIMVVSNVEPNYIYTCLDCNYCETPDSEI